MSSIRVPRRTRRRTADTHHSPPRGPTLTTAATAAATAGRHRRCRYQITGHALCHGRQETTDPIPAPNTPELASPDQRLRGHLVVLKLQDAAERRRQRRKSCAINCRIWLTHSWRADAVPACRWFISSCTISSRISSLRLIFSRFFSRKSSSIRS